MPTGWARAPGRGALGSGAVMVAALAAIALAGVVARDAWQASH